MADPVDAREAWSADGTCDRNGLGA
jgi:hypothetical protein